MTRHDPQGEHEIWLARYRAARDDFSARRFPMTESVFRATLYGLGFRGREIEAEINQALEK